MKSDSSRELINALKETNNALNGRIEALNEWNNSLREECRELREIIYRRFGLVNQESHLTSNVDMRPIPQSEIWRTAKSKLEQGHRVQSVPELDATQKYWDDKLKQQEAAQDAKVQKEVVPS